MTMTMKQWSDIQRQLGYIEGLSMCVEGDVGSYLSDAVDALVDTLERLAPVGGADRQR